MRRLILRYTLRKIDLCWQRAGEGYRQQVPDFKVAKSDLFSAWLYVVAIDLILGTKGYFAIGQKKIPMFIQWGPAAIFICTFTSAATTDRTLMALNYTIEN